MSNQTNQVMQPSVMGSVLSLLSTTAKAAEDTVKTVGNIASAAQHLTAVCDDKAQNIAEISRTSDSIKMLHKRAEMAKTMQELGVVVDDNGVMSFTNI